MKSKTSSFLKYFQNSMDLTEYLICLKLRKSIQNFEKL